MIMHNTPKAACRLLVVLSLIWTQTATAQEATETQTEPDTQQSSMTPGATPAKSLWTLEIKGGDFEPELEGWEVFYGEDHTDQAGFSASYKFLRQAEVGLAVDYIHDEGVGFLPLNDELGGEVDFQMYPAHLYILLRGVFFDDQWVVPYIGGGATRVYYRQEIENQASVRGKVNGDHTRAGLQILLDWLDTGNAVGFEEEGIENTYLTVEVLSFSAELEGVELGGDSVVFGFAFEF